MKKRLVYLFVGLMILIAGIFIITAAVNKTKQWHPDTNIKIIIDGSEKTLQQAINENLFTGSHTYASPSSTPAGGHKADAIWVSVGGVENNLVQALSSTGLCGSPTASYTGPSDKTKSYHYATEIEVTVDSSVMSLQDAIDSGKWCYGWILIPGNPSLGTSDFLVMKYEAKNVNSKPVSQEALTPWRTNFNNAKSACASLGVGYHLITNAEWMTIAKNIENTPASWTGGAVGNGMIKRGNVGIDDEGSYRKYSLDYGTGRDTKAELKLSTGASIWDFSGNADEWVNGMCTPGSGNGFWYTLSCEWTNISLADFERAEAGPSTSINYGENPTSKGAGRYYGCRYEDYLNISPQEYVLIAHAFTRGGGYSHDIYAGIFSINYQVEIDSNYGGFRCVKTSEQYSYSWNISSRWGTCDSGAATRTVNCIRNDGTIVADSYCLGTKPPTSQQCWDGDVWSSSCPWGLPCWTGEGCSSCPWGTVQFGGDPYNIYCKTNGRQGAWRSIFGSNEWREYGYNDYSAKCCCTRSTSSGPYYNTRWRIID